MTDLQPERRQSMVNYVTRKGLDEKLTNEREQITKHIDARFDALEKIVKSGFPNGDLSKHRDAHEIMIKSFEDKEALWKSVREKTISGGVWAGLGLIMLALWEYIKSGVHK